MADLSSTPSQDPSPTVSEPENPSSNPQPVQSDPQLPTTSPPTSAPALAIPNANPSLAKPTVVAPLPPSVPSFTFRPAGPIGPPQFSPLPASSFQTPGMVQPPGVSHSPNVVGTQSPAVSVPPMMPYQALPQNPALRPYAPLPNGYPGLPPGSIPPPGIPRYPSPYPAMVRPAYPPRLPGSVGVLPAFRPPGQILPGVRPNILPVARPAVVPVTSAEKPLTTVYVGKISSTVENDFMLSLLQLCGPVRSWKRPQDPSDGTLKHFGFCEFESAEGVLRALRLLSKVNVDGQELVLNVDQATREYLERYVQKKTENMEKLKNTEGEVADKEDENAAGLNKEEASKLLTEETKKDGRESGDKENNASASFGLVTDDDRKADLEALEKLRNLIEERLKTKPLPPPPAIAAVGSLGKENSDVLSKLKDGDSDVEDSKNEDKNDDDTASENKTISEHDKPEASSPDRSRRYDRRSKDRDRERDLKREKEWEYERLEREAQRERERKEWERERKNQEYKERLKEWESREREKEKQRQHEKDREKERDRKRRKEIREEESDDEDLRKRMRRSVLEEKRRKRLREKDDDLDDRIKEEDEIAEAKKRSEEEQHLQQQRQRDALKLLSSQGSNGTGKAPLAEEIKVDSKNVPVSLAQEGDSGHINHISDSILQNGIGNESLSAADTQQSMIAPARKLGFGLVGSGKRAAVPSVFDEEEDNDERKEKKMRPLVPIDYSAEELQAVQLSTTGSSQPNLAAAAEFAKRISTVSVKEEKLELEKERRNRYHDRHSQRDRDRNDENRDEHREKFFERERDRERGQNKSRAPENKKLLDAKQLIDMIPKTREELFSYEINWTVYDKHELHERMRPWISKKITEFLGEEETTLVDYIVSGTREHVKASQMLELLQSILDEEAEMFVLKMWRMLIFEIKKVETGLAPPRSKP